MPNCAAPDGHLLLDRNVRAAGLDADVEALVLVIALHQRGIEAAVLGLRIPVGLQRDLRESGIR